MIHAGPNFWVFLVTYAYGFTGASQIMNIWTHSLRTWTYFTRSPLKKMIDLIDFNVMHFRVKFVQLQYFIFIFHMNFVTDFTVFMSSYDHIELKRERERRTRITFQNNTLKCQNSNKLWAIRICHPVWTITVTILFLWSSQAMRSSTKDSFKIVTDNEPQQNLPNIQFMSW